MPEFSTGARPRPASPADVCLSGLADAIRGQVQLTCRLIGHPHTSGPPRQVLPEVEVLLRTAGELVDLMAAYTRRCALARAAFAGGEDWDICHGDLHAGLFHLVGTTGERLGCVVHLAAARAGELGVIAEADVRRRADLGAARGDLDGGRGAAARRRHRNALNRVGQMTLRAPDGSTDAAVADVDGRT